MSDLPEPPASPPPSSRFHAGRLVLGLVVVVIGVAALLQAAGVSDVPWKAVLPGSLIAVGLGLVIAGRRSESGQGGLIAIGIVLTVLLAAASAVDIPLEGGLDPGLDPLAGHPRHRACGLSRWPTHRFPASIRGPRRDLFGALAGGE